MSPKIGDVVVYKAIGTETYVNNYYMNNDTSLRFVVVKTRTYEIRKNETITLIFSQIFYSNKILILFLYILHELINENSSSLIMEFFQFLTQNGEFFNRATAMLKVFRNSKQSHDVLCDLKHN